MPISFRSASLRSRKDVAINRIFSKCLGVLLKPKIGEPAGNIVHDGDAISSPSPMFAVFSPQDKAC